MAIKIGSSFSCVATSLSYHSQSRRSSQLSLLRGLFDGQQFGSDQLRNTKVKSRQFIHGILKVKERFPKRRYILCTTSEDQLPNSELELDDLELELDDPEQYKDNPLAEDTSDIHNSNLSLEGIGGRPGLISFYNRPYQRENEVLLSGASRNQSNLVWFIGPSILVASFIFPSLYLRRILSSVFEDSLLTDFLILFFTEALFYCGVAMFLLLIDRSRRPMGTVSAANNRNPVPQLGHRISSVAVLVLSLIIPMVTMGLVWPWTGPAASATLAPYLVGIVVQFTFEQYARYIKSPSWPVIPVIFQVYRLHQLNRAAQLVTALSFTVKGAEMTSHNVAINGSLGTLLNVLQFLGVICIWSLSSFLMRFFPSATID